MSLPQSYYTADWPTNDDDNGGEDADPVPPSTPSRSRRAESNDVFLQFPSELASFSQITFTLTPQVSPTTFMTDRVRYTTSPPTTPSRSLRRVDPPPTTSSRSSHRVDPPPVEVALSSPTLSRRNPHPITVNLGESSQSPLPRPAPASMEDNLVLAHRTLDPGDPLYPCLAGDQHPLDPTIPPDLLPRALNNYYVVFRGLKLGVFYTPWYIHYNRYLRSVL